MPWKSKKECAWSGCHTTTNQRHCPAHARIAAQTTRLLGRMRRRSYSGNAWAELRQRVIVRDRGICQMCKKPIKRAADIHVDHRIEKADGGTDDIRNLQLLDKSCHSRKTMAARRARGERI